MRNLIREGKTHQILSQIQLGGSMGMMTMDANLAELCLKRVISYDMGMSRAVDAKEFARLVETGGLGGGSNQQGQNPKAGAPSRPQQPSANPVVGRGNR